MDSSHADRAHTYADEGASWHPALRAHNDQSTCRAPPSSNDLSNNTHDGRVEQSLDSQTAADVVGVGEDHYQQEHGSGQRDDVEEAVIHAFEAPDDLKTLSSHAPAVEATGSVEAEQVNTNTEAVRPDEQDMSAAREQWMPDARGRNIAETELHETAQQETPPPTEPFHLAEGTTINRVAENASSQLDDNLEQMVVAEEEDVENIVSNHADYEHQGDLTEAEIAVDEAPTASLLSHEESQMIPEQSVDDVVTLEEDQQPQPAKFQEDQTLNNTHAAPPSETAGLSEAEHHADAFDWGNTDDTDFGAELGLSAAQPSPEDNNATSVLDSSGQNRNAFGPLSQPTEDDLPNKVEAKKEDDIAALWAAALGEDEFLDDTKAVDPSSFFGDDDAGFLEDDSFASAPSGEAPTSASHTVPSQSRSSEAQSSTTSRYTPASPQSQPYSPQRSIFADHSFNPRAASTPSTEFPAAFAPSAPNTSLRPAGPQASRSFADRTKQGYASPYDLPMDIVQPRKRAAAPITPAAPPNLPPPRSSSIPPSSAPPSQSQFPIARQGPSITSPPSQVSSAQAPPTSAPSSASRTAGANVSAKKGDAGFFADLPVTVKPKLRPSGSFTPIPASSSNMPPQGPPSRPPSRPVGGPASAYGGLAQPERLPLLPDQPQTMQPGQSPYNPAASGVSATISGPPGSSLPPSANAAAPRYSPAPVQPSIGSVPATSRYSPAPGAQPFPAKVQAFIPKTSSPLAYHEESAARQPSISNVHTVDYSDQGAPKSAYVPSAGPARVVTPLQGQQPLPSVQQYSPQTDRYAPSANATGSVQSPPKRSQTQSPSLVVRQTAQKFPTLDRSASALTVPAYQAAASIPRNSGLALPPARRQFSTDLSYAVPQDERSADPLERWKGCPIFRWAPSGALVSSFPQQAPFYAAGHGIPSIKCTPGSVTVHDSKVTLPLSEQDARFPGPLNGKGKGKKKDVIAWLSSKIEVLEKQAAPAPIDLSTDPQLKKRAEEKIILWKVVKLLIENDNNLEKSSIEGQVRQVLLPDFDPAQSAESSLTDGALGTQGEVVTPESLSIIRRHLLEGQREKAVWYATEKKMWAHAMLIASTLGPQVWKQVSSEFVKAQVMGVGPDLQSLAALYDVFASNSEECVDELVPPSARAGFQMVSKRDSMGSSARNPLDGLDKWRETLSLIISNRSSTDTVAIAALGRLLSSYGRVEAAHTCFLFARSVITYNGADNPDASFVLLGADHKTQATGLGGNLDAIMLTEVYEYALSLTPTPGTSPIMPHLQSFKLVHAYELAEHGLRAEAQAYCDAIFTAVKSSTRASPYYHAAFTASVEDLTKCLSQAPQTGPSSGWVSKLSSEKVSGSMWKRFNNFVAGEEGDSSQDASGAPSGAPTAGPFGGITGETPTVSRAASSTDLYGAMSGATFGTPSQGGVGSPYTPSAYGSVRASPQQSHSGRYAPQSSSGFTPRASLESTRSYEPERPNSGYASQPAVQRAASTPYGAYIPQVQTKQKPSAPGATLYTPRPEASRAASDYGVPYSQESSRRSSLQNSYQPQPAGQPSPQATYMPLANQPSTMQTEETSASPYNPSSSQYQPSPSFEPPPASYKPSTPKIPEEPIFEQEEANHSTQEPYTASHEPLAASFEPAQASFDDEVSGYEPPTTSYEPPSASYEPPAASYEPPSASYEPPAASYEPSAASYEPPSASYEPPSASYEPNTTSDEPANSYEPPSASYEPYQPDYGNDEAELADDEPKPKKKSFMDLDNDEPSFAASKQDEMSKAEARAQADREANEAVRKAAEADAARDKAEKEAAAKKGWFGGWFGKKEGDAPTAVRAKLGEQSSFYFDKDLNKWVNKKGGTEETASSPTPPPPRGVASRAVSAAGAPPSGPPSRSASGMGVPPMSRPATAGTGPPSRSATPGGDANGTPPLSPPAGLQPPSRPSTGLSQASSIDDLLGAAGPRKAGGGGAKAKKKGRYVDVMAKP